MRCAAAIPVLILLSLLGLSSCGEFAGWNPDRRPETGDLEEVNLYLNDGELEVLYDSVVVDRPALCRYEARGESLRGEIQIRGLSSRMDPKKSFTFQARESLLKDALDAGGDPWIEYALAMKAYDLAGLPVADFRPAALYLNDSYLGYYNRVRLYNDSLNDHYGDSRGELFKITIFDEFEDQVDQVPIHGNSEKKFPDDGDFSLLDNFFAAAANLSDPEWEDWATAHTDFREIARYMAVRDFFGLEDTVRVNFYIYFHHDRALILPWDSDRGYTYGDMGGNNLITKRMMDIPAFREFYKDEVNRLFLQPGAENILDELAAYSDETAELLGPSVAVEPAYFLDRKGFDEETAAIAAFLAARPGDILGRPEWSAFFSP